MSREAIPTWFFAMVVVRLGRRFLVAHERKHGQRWYLPAGRVEPGETIVDAAVRETYEETGVRVKVDALLRVEHAPSPEGARVRVFVLASPIDDEAPRAEPNEHSLEARWVTLDELDTLALRGDEVREVFRYVAEGGAVYPLHAFTWEGAPWRQRSP
jgi:phosphatase NudJ